MRPKPTCGKPLWPLAPKRVGLLGGSFNPAHEGHLAISLAAMKALKLHQIWWLVTPQNPLKSNAPAEMEERLAHCRRVIRRHRCIIPMALELTTNTRYTVDTIAALKRHYPHVQFFWIMGSDNLAGFHRWKNWRKIAETLPIMIADRAPFSHASIHAKAAIALRQKRRPSSRALSASKNGWAMRRQPRLAISSSQLRSRAK